MLIAKRTFALLCLTILFMLPALITQASFAQFISCKVVNLNLVPPSIVQAGQPFQVTSNVTASCDPSVLPVIRVDLVDESTSQTLSSTSVPYYTYSSSFTASIVNQATARQLTGSWALEVQVYIISEINGQSVASASQVFQVNVQPYTPPVTEMQTTEPTNQGFSNSSTVSVQILPATTSQQVTTEAFTSSHLTFPTQTASTPTNELLLPVAILLVGLAVFGLLVYAGQRRSRTIKASKYCGQCGTSLNAKESYCTNCGAKQTE